MVLTEFGKKLLDSKPSMLQDVEAKRLSEVDAINGMVVTLGKELGIETPYNKVGENPLDLESALS